jgi:hypothetical protein
MRTIVCIQRPEAVKGGALALKAHVHNIIKAKQSKTKANQLNLPTNRPPSHAHIHPTDHPTNHPNYTNKNNNKQLQ